MKNSPIDWTSGWTWFALLQFLTSLIGFIEIMELALVSTGIVEFHDDSKSEHEN